MSYKSIIVSPFLTSLPLTTYSGYVGIYMPQPKPYSYSF